MAIERHEIVNRAQWLALRKADVTASRVGALFAAHPYVTPLRLYMEQAGVEFPEQEETPVMRRGRLLEGAVAMAVAEQRPDWTVTKNNFYYRDPEHRLGATPDFFIDGDPRGLGVLQTKTAAPYVFERDWDNGKTIPFWIMLQTLTECLLTGAAFGVVAPLRVDAFDLACPILEIPRHPTAEAKIYEAVGQFWHDVRTGHEPEPDYGKDASLLPILAPRAVEDKIADLSTDNELPVLLAQRQQLRTDIRAYEARCDAIEAELKFKMRDAERAHLPGWSITWKNQHREAFTVAAKDMRVLRIHAHGESA
jgi:predicted phage-related endonuclease